MEIIFLSILFILVTGASFYFIERFQSRRIDERLLTIKNESLLTQPEPIDPLELYARKVVTWLVTFSMPHEEWETSEDRIRFLRAGYRSEKIILIYFTAKTLLTLMLPTVYLLLYLFSGASHSTFRVLVTSFCLATAGYYFPNFYLSQRIKARQQEIFESFPDALDLMRVCIGAGLGLDGSLMRVGQELSIKSRALSEEFHILNLELRAGAVREHAMRNLAERTGVEDIHSLVAMLIQSERFGTSVSDSLKVHAEGLRSKRKMLAQEAAAKIPVKLTIPMILCIFPALFVVILGPAVINIIHTILPLMRATH